MTLQLMRSRLFSVFTLFSLVIAGCVHSPSFDPNGISRILDEHGCYLIEEYNSEDEHCYLICDDLNEQQCDELALQVYGELDEFIDDDFEGHDELSDDDASSKHIASYSINQALSLTTLSNTKPNDDESFKDIWNAVLAILPQDFLRNELVEFRINTDGLDNTLAYVSLHESIPEKWIIAIDSADFIDEKDKEFIHTVIHEFAHIVFLNKTQVHLNQFNDCTNYSITEGCAKSNSYINSFYSRFWVDIVKDNPSALADEDPEDEDEIARFYEKYSTQFVGEYAATNPVEDIAEVFAHFVLEKKPLLPNSIAERKIAFLYQFPELTQLRNKIRTKLRKHSAFE